MEESLPPNHPPLLIALSIHIQQFLVLENLKNLQISTSASHMMENHTNQKII